MCPNCAYHVDNWIYGYQVYCTLPTEFWVNTGGYILLIILLLITVYFCVINYKQVKR